MDDFNNFEHARKILYGILCDNEKEDLKWERSLENLLIELAGYDSTESNKNYGQLLAKLSIVKMLNQKYFRKTIFDCMSICEKAKDDV